MGSFPPMLPFRPAAILLLAPALAAAQDVDLAEKMFRSGERAYAQKAYAEAFETWNQLVKAAQGSDFAAQALLRMARHHWEVDRKPEAALALLERVKAEHLRDGHAAEAMLRRGIILAAQARKPDDLKAPVAEFTRVLELFPTHPAVAEVRFELGTALKDLGQPRKALSHFIEACRQHPSGPTAPKSLIQAAECLDAMGDLDGCLRLLQRVRNQAPGTAEAAEAGWRINLRVKHRVFRPTPRSEGPWPDGRTKWLKTPTLLATDVTGGLYIYQEDLDGQATQLRGGAAVPVGPKVPGARAMCVAPDGAAWLAQPKMGLHRGDSGAMVPLPAVAAPSGMFVDRWGTAWLADAKNPQLTFVAPDGTARSVPSPALTALAPFRDGAVAASDANRTLIFLDAQGQPMKEVPYGKDMPAAFRYVLALATDPTGNLAALVDGDFDGVVVWGPDGAVLRFATYRALGISGKFRSLAFDREGGLILADRYNDLLVRLN